MGCRWWVRAFTPTVGKKKKTGQVHESRFRAAELLGFPQFAHCNLKFFDTASARVKCCQDHGKSLLRRTSRKVTHGCGGHDLRASPQGILQFYLTASQAELAKAVSETKVAKVETQSAQKRNFLLDATLLTQ